MAAVAVQFTARGLANVAGSDNFDDNSKDATRWGADSGFVLPAGQSLPGQLSETGGHLEFTSAGNAHIYQARPWILNYGAADADWEVQLDTSVLGTPDPGQDNSRHRHRDLEFQEDQPSMSGLSTRTPGSAPDFVSYDAETSPDLVMNTVTHPAAGLRSGAHHL